MNHAAGVRVAEVLDLVPGTRVLAGASGLNRPIQSIGMIEAPDSLQFVRAGDLILTALWAIKDDRGAQLQLVPELVRRGAAGLAIKLRYVDELPAQLLEQAELHSFPVLQLTTDIPFSQVMQPVMGQIINRQALMLARQQRAHRAVMQAVLDAKGLPRLAEILAELLENPVVIRDEMGHVVAVGRCGDQPAGLDLAELALLEPRSTDYQLSTGDTMHAVEVVGVQGQRLTRYVTTVKSGNTVYGQVQTWEFGRRLDETDLSIIDSVSTVIALEMANRRALLAVERRYHNEFLVALFSSEAHSEMDLLMRASRFGWNLAKPHYAVALKVEGGRSQRDLEEALVLQDRLYDGVLRSAGPGAVVGQAELHTVILLPARSKGDAREEAMSAARHLQEQAAAYSRLAKVSVGIGTVQTGVRGMRRSFEEARKAIRIGEQVWGPGCLTHYAELGLYQILAMLQPTPELEEFLACIRKLEQYDAKHHTTFVETLTTYFACNGNVRKVSEQMYAHYNTILYRLQRIAEITGRSPEDAEGRHYLYVALQAYKLFGQELPAEGARPQRMVPAPGPGRRQVGS
jgi:purine catabolism regulator